jgi:Putative Actinobacterial Holin-X, holin superfamily III
MTTTDPRAEVTDVVQAGEPEAKARAAATSPGQLASELAKDMSTLVRQEVALAKVELQQEAKTAGTAVGAFGGAGFAGYFVLLFLSLAGMYGLDSFMPIGWAALIVGAVWGVVAAVLAVIGRKKLKNFSPKPERTIDTVKEDVQWAKTRNS